MEIEKTKISFIFSYADKSPIEWIEEVYNAEEVKQILGDFLQELRQQYKICYEKENGNFLIYF